MTLQWFILNVLSICDRCMMIPFSNMAVSTASSPSLIFLLQSRMAQISIKICLDRQTVYCDIPIPYICFTVLVNLGISLLNFSGSSLAPSFQYSNSIHASSGICASIASIHCPSAGASGTTPVSSTY
jgi:hypothetical protein